MITRLLYFYRNYLLKQKITKVNRFNFHPLSEHPAIVLLYTPSGLDHLAHVAPRVPANVPCYFLVFFNWYVNPVQILAIYDQARRIQSLNPQIQIHALCNSDKEYQNFRRLAPGLPVHFINQNIVLDEEVYTVDNSVSKKYNAVYNARMMPFKRFELAADVENLSIITCGWKSLDQAYFNKVHKALAGAEWHNLDEDLAYHKLTPEEVSEKVNMARVGLILSKAEGACFAATEYLLSGLPVVSTKSRGGRDTLFTTDTACIVDDTPAAVANGVRRLMARDLDPWYVRKTTMDIINTHRRRLFDLVNRIYQENGQQRDFAREWPDRFTNKMINFTEYEAFWSFVNSTTTL